MRKSISNIVKVAIAAATIGTVATPAMAQSWRDQGRFDNRYDRDQGRDYGRGGWQGGPLQGRGVERLHPMLKATGAGQRFAMRYDYNRDGRLSWNEAAEANRQLIRVADRNGDSHVTDREASRVL